MSILILNMLILYLIFFFSFFLPSHQENECGPPKTQENELLSKLTHNLESCITERGDPYPSDSKAKIDVQMEILDVKLLDHNIFTNEKRFEFTLNYKWRNEFTSWNKDQYQQEVVFMNGRRVWHPRIILHFLQNKGRINWHTKIKMYYNGTHEMLQTYEFHMNCDNFFSKFPNDEHSCLFPLTFNRKTVTDINYYLYNYTRVSSKVKEWNVQFDKIFSNELFAFFRPNNPNHITLWYLILKVKRVPNLYTSLIIIPSLLLSIFILLSFLVPAKNNQRFALTLFIFLCLLIQYLSLQNALPIHSNDVPIIVKYILLLMFLLYVSIAISVTTTLLRKQIGSQRVPLFVKTIFSFPLIQRLLLVSQHSEAILQPSIPHVQNGNLKRMMVMLDEWVFLKSHQSGLSDKAVNSEFKFVALSIERIVFAAATVVVLVATGLTASQII